MTTTLNSAERQKALDAAMSQIERQYGKGAILTAPLPSGREAVKDVYQLSHDDVAGILRVMLE